MQEEVSELQKCQQQLKEQVDSACSVLEKTLVHRQTKFSEDLNLIYLPMLRKSFHDAATGSKDSIPSNKFNVCRVKLNVGGGLFETTSRTLCAVPGSLLFELGESASIAVAAANASGAAAAAAEAADPPFLLTVRQGFLTRCTPRLIQCVRCIFTYFPPAA